MTNAEQKQLIKVDRRQFAAALLHPSTLLLIAANSVPLWGVFYWGWDVFVLLALYWLETAIIGFWMIVRIALMPPDKRGTIEVNGVKRAAGALFLTAFFLVHAGIFMTVHMVFLWSLFSGDWPSRIHGLGDFVGKLVIGTGMWVPLVVLFIVRGFAFLIHLLKPETLAKLERSFGLAPSAKPAADNDIGEIVGGFYGRVVIMHVSILFGAFIAQIFGTIAPLIIMVAVKTVADIGLHMKFDTGGLARVSQTVTAVT